MRLNQEVDTFLKQNILLDYYKDGKLDLQELCEKMNIGVYDADFEDDKISGAIKHENGSWTIYLNNSDPANRKRFTVAHELGHYFSYVCNSFSKLEIDKNEGIIEDFAFSRSAETDITKPEEVEANLIAAQILMPEASIKQMINNKNIEEMSEHFGVSESAMTFRLKNLGYRLLEEIGETDDPVCLQKEN